LAAASTKTGSSHGIAKAALVALAVGLAAPIASSEDYPSRPIRRPIW